uniref:Uncharacterized protein n=1 Tax=Bracon brevicornis TaxID=1563983 RepID=A0A6V7JYD0_9HYME
MAIPFALPTEDENEIQSQQLEQLMLELYAALQQVLRTRNSQHPSRNREYFTVLVQIMMVLLSFRLVRAMIRYFF